MSTYLLAFACGDLHSVEAKTKSGVLLRSWASLAQPKQNLQFSLDEGIKVLEFYEDYFGTKFPLKKLDQLALPDFDSGAMENWGLITYREVAMLTDPTNRSIPSEQYVALVIAHELSHQWFGNLVTMKWWDDLWLNESFASLIEHICLDALHPDWHQWEHYTSSDVITASNRDIYSDVQPVGVSVKHPDEIITLFDPAIVYAKGGRLLKMMREFIGEEAFKAALKSYFKIHAYKNTTREDLWAEMSKASGQNIAELMTPWLTQSGMPILKVEATDNDNQRLISQSRFVLDNVSDSQLWPVPLLVSGQVKPNIIDKESAVIELASDTPPIFNSSGSGHYVVHYAEASDHKAILAQVKQRTANTEARINILNDLLLLARRGDNSLVDALQVIEHMNDEPRDAVWALMARGIGLASGIGEFNQLLDSGLKKLRVQLASKHFQRLGWDDTPTEDLNTISLRSTILSLMLSGEDETTIADALSRYRSIKNIEAIPADRRGHLLGAAVRHSDDPAVIDQLIAKYQETPDADLQISIGSALCATKSSEVVNRLLAEAMGPDGFVRSQDLFRWFAYLMRNKYSREQAWQWLVNSWDRIAEESGGAKSLEYYIWYAAAPIQTEEWFSKFKAMFEPKKKIVVLERNILVAEAEITARIKWHNREISKLENYVKSVQ